MQSQALGCFSVLPVSLVSVNFRSFKRRSCSHHKLFQSRVGRHGIRVRRRVLRVFAMDDDFGDVSLFNDVSDNETNDAEVISQQTCDSDMPTPKERFPPSHDSTRTNYGLLNNVGLISFSAFLILFMDLYGWQIARLPLPIFHFMRPFLTSMVLVACFGAICAPIFCNMKLQSNVKKELPQHSHKQGTPTMGGLYFVPIGILVAESALGFSSIQVSGAATATLAFAAIGLLHDFLTINKNNYGLSGWLRVSLEVAFGVCFSYWAYAKNISTPFHMKMGKLYPLLTWFFFFSMPNGINVTDGLDGLAAGTAALAFIGMSIVVLPVCCDLSIFGASMAGACIGFLFQNQYKASIYMGDTGALALGGGLAAMATCTGMFFPLFIASGVFVLEASSVALQVAWFKATKYLRGKGYRLLGMAPLHHQFELRGIKEPVIVAAAYVVGGLLSLCAAYVGLTLARAI